MIKLEQYFDNLDAFIYLNLKKEDIFDTLEDISKDEQNGEDNQNIEDLNLDDELNLNDNDISANNDLQNVNTDNNENNKKEDDIKENIATAIKIASLLNKFENIYYELMVVKSKLEKHVTNQIEFWNEIRKFELMLTILIKKLNNDNVDEIEELLDLYKETLYNYLKDNIIITDTNK